MCFNFEFSVEDVVNLFWDLGFFFENLWLLCMFFWLGRLLLFEKWLIRENCFWVDFEYVIRVVWWKWRKWNWEGEMGFFILEEEDFLLCMY